MCAKMGTKYKYLTSIRLHMYLAGYTYAEICEITKATDAEINTLIKKFRKYIRESYTDSTVELPFAGRALSVKSLYMRTKMDYKSIALAEKVSVTCVSNIINAFENRVLETFNFKPLRITKEYAQIISMYAMGTERAVIAKQLSLKYSVVKDVIYRYKLCFEDFLNQMSIKDSKPKVPQTSIKPTKEQRKAVTENKHNFVSESEVVNETDIVSVTDVVSETESYTSDVTETAMDGKIMQICTDFDSTTLQDLLCVLRNRIADLETELKTLNTYADCIKHVYENITK